VQRLVDERYRSGSRRGLAPLIRLLGDGLAEAAVHDAVAAALRPEAIRHGRLFAESWLNRTRLAAARQAAR
jgi:hypothetical protein